MGIVLSKNLKQKQSIKLTPSLKKSIDLLQLSRFELIKKIENEIIENPFWKNRIMIMIIHIMKKTLILISNQN